MKYLDSPTRLRSIPSKDAHVSVTKTPILMRRILSKKGTTTRKLRRFEKAERNTQSWLEYEEPFVKIIKKEEWVIVDLPVETTTFWPLGRLFKYLLKS